MKILFLSRWFPYPPNNGSKIRIYNLLVGLAKSNRVSLISFFPPGEGDPNIEALRACCESIKVVPWNTFRPQSTRAIAGFLSSKPRYYFDTFSPEFQEVLDDTLRRNQYDLVIASQIDMAVYAPSFRQVPSIFEEAEVGYLYEQYQQARSISERLRYGLTWKKHQHFLGLLLHKYHICTVVSSQEAQLIQQNVTAKTKIVVIPNGVDLRNYDHSSVQPIPHTLIFTGAFSFEPNFQAMEWFVKYIYPRVIERAPDVCLTITGDHAGRTLSSTDHVRHVGFVEDIKPIISRAWCSIAPIRAGGGTRLKILEAMAVGTPVVTTSKGTEGLDVINGQHLLIADEPDSFAHAILTLFSDESLRQRITSNALQLIKEKYDWSVIMPKFLELVDSTVG
jgi:glycosyltransferase involved in cell wall biosynthesis